MSAETSNKVQPKGTPSGSMSEKPARVLNAERVAAAKNEFGLYMSDSLDPLIQGAVEQRLERKRSLDSLYKTFVETPSESAANEFVEAVRKVLPANRLEALRIEITKLEGERV